MSETLLQLLVFEHATGDVTVQTEVGAVIVSAFGGISYFREGNVGYLRNGGDMSVRETIDKAVAEQFGQRPEPPLPRIVENEYGGGWFAWSDDPKQDVPLSMGALSALRNFTDPKLPVVDAAESSSVSVWTQVFPPESPCEFRSAIDRERQQGRADVIYELQKETAFTIWRLRVTR